MNAYKSRESVAKGTAFQQLAVMLPEFRAALGNTVVDGVLKRYPKALYSKSSEQAQFALDALQAKMKSPPQPPAGESAQIIFNEVPEREFVTPKAWTDEIQIGDEVLQAGQWWKVTRIGSDNTGPFIYYDKPGQLPVMGNNKDEGRIRPWQVRTARRDGIEFSELVPFVPAPPASVEPVPAAAPIIRTMAQRRAMQMYPDFDWHGYEAAMRRQLDSKLKFKHLPFSERIKALADPKIPLPKDNRTEEEKMSDKALVTTGSALIKTSWDSIDEVKRLVIGAYGQGNSALTDKQCAAIVALAWSMNLDPSPGVGHIYAWEKSGKLVLTIGYQGLLHKAQQQQQFFYNEPRPMTDEERDLHKLGKSDVGAVCELVEMRRARMAKELGLSIPYIRGIAIWKDGENIAKSKSGFWMASKNAIKDAIRQLGIGFGSMMPPQLDGFAYDRNEDSYIEVKPERAGEITSGETQEADDVALEGEIMDTLKAAIGEAPGESAQSEPAQVVAPRYSPSELKSKFDQAVNALISKWNKSDNPGRVQEVANIESLLLEFGDVCTVTEARTFIASLIGKQASAAQAEILKSKILNSPEQARLEIADYLKVFGSAPASDDKEAKV